MARAPAAGAVLQNLIQTQNNLLQTLVNAPMFHPAPAAPAPPVENAMVTVLKKDVIPKHLHNHIPERCSWRTKVHLLEPGFWMVVAILKPVPLARTDLVKDMELSGDFVKSFIEGLEQHFPGLSVERKNLIVGYFTTMMKLYVMYLPSITALLAANPVNVDAVRACAEQLVADCLPTIRLARAITLQLDAESLSAEHGATAAAMYTAHVSSLNGDAHLGDATAIKQVMYHSHIHRLRGKTATDLPSNLQGKGSKCRRCQQEVVFGGFKEHNKVCPKKGVGKKKK